MAAVSAFTMQRREKKLIEILCELFNPLHQHKTTVMFIMLPAGGYSGVSLHHETSRDRPRVLLLDQSNKPFHCICPH